MTPTLPDAPSADAPSAPAPARVPASGATETNGHANGHGNGHSPGPPDRGGSGGAPPPPRPAGPSVKLALIVVGIATLVLLIGIIGAALTSSGSAQAPATHTLRTAAGAGITAVPGRGVLAAITADGQPPSDILNVVPVPQGTVVTAGSATDNGIGLFDHTLSFTVPVSDQKVITFYGAELKSLKWQIVSQGPAPKGTPGYRIVAQHPSEDGYEWEIGVTVAPTTFASTTAAPADTTSYSLRLFAVTDDD